MSIAAFYKLIKSVDANEAAVKRAKRLLCEDYAKLVLLCPHTEAVDRKSNMRGMGTTRRCKICGVTDYASEGGTPGDEYDYGYPGYPSKSFWAEAEVEVVTDEIFDSYGRSHDYRVKDGKVHK